MFLQMTKRCICNHAKSSKKAESDANGTAGRWMLFGIGGLLAGIGMSLLLYGKPAKSAYWDIDPRHCFGRHEFFSIDA
jgi:hypothetical protein